MATTTFKFFVTVPRGLEGALQAELQQIGVVSPRPGLAGVGFEAGLETGYRVLLWSRIGSRVLLELARFSAPDEAALYRGTRGIDWPALFAPEARIAVAATLRRAPIGNSHFAALRVKDAIVDGFREAGLPRPSVDTRQADIRIHCHMEGEQVTLSLDLAGPALHRRGYRREGVEAPLRENLAAGMLWLLGWPKLAERGWRFLDPMCGSGTLPIEAAMMAADIAPGLLRRQWGFQAWRGHDAPLWQRLLDEARQRREAGLSRLPPILGRDRDAEAVRAARGNARHAGLADHIGFERGDIGDLGPLPGPGLVAVNPPYGERLEQGGGLARLYGRLGRMLQGLPGWRCGVLSGAPGLLHRLRLKPRRQWSLYNGALPVRLVSCTVPQGSAEPAAPAASQSAIDPGLATPFANRLRKNLRHLGKWARREGVDCYRAYDADIPEFALAVDRYATEDDGLHLVVYEYRAPATVDATLAEQRLQAALAALPEVFGIDPEHIHLKRRARQKGEQQYRRTDHTGRFHVVHEGPARLRVNFDDYLDTGLFLDHRITRARLRAQAEGKRFLNLFCYTATATVQAALGGAAGSLSVDLSATYLDWAAENLRLNGIEPGSDHRLQQADCLAWLEQAQRSHAGGFDLIFLDPPTFSNSSRMREVLDINRDHPRLIRQAMTLLAPGGTLVFSTNSRRFRMDKELKRAFTMEDITRATIPEDFRRNPKIHQCWTIRHREP